LTDESEYKSIKPIRSISKSLSPNTVNQNIVPEFNIAGLSADLMSAKVREGLMPIEAKNIFGDTEIAFIKQPSSPKPQLFIIEHYKTCNYLGNYGAGKTIKTMSLLPGEKVKISIKTFKQLISDAKKYQNVLDSFNRETTDELQTSIEGELGLSFSLDISISKMISTILGITIPVEGVPLNISSNNTNQQTLNSSRGINMNILASAINKQVSKSSNLREIEVNTETNIKESTEETTELVREFENINHSRVLNFVFRQLLQEYVSITYLNEVSFMYSNGYPETTKIVKLDGLKRLIEDVIEGSHVNEVFNGIVCELCSVYDYLGDRKKFIEKKTIQITDIDNNPVRTDEFIRKDPSLLMIYPQTGSQITSINGVILDVQQRIIPTDSVIVDALLGQGEALDCYNMKLQDAATVKAKLDNDALTQQMTIIDAQTTEADKADKYKKVFGTCCENPQTQIIS